MKKLWIYLGLILAITVILPTIIVKTVKLVQIKDETEGRVTVEEIEEENIVDEFDGYIKVYDTRIQEVVKMPLEDYVKGVVAAEMPGEFHIEALKAQAVASRTYALYRSQRFSEGHPDHPTAPLCTGVHCQAFLSLGELESIHSKKWVDKYWSKIEEAVNSTKGEIIYYDGEIIEPLYHSTSGGMTEDSIDVFATDVPYLKSVKSPDEEGAPKYKEITTFTIGEFLSKLKEKYPGVNVNKDNLPDKVKLVEKSDSGRVKKIFVDGQIVEGREIRELYGLNSTNFKILYNPRTGIVDIETIGYGHGVGMSQWGANAMGKKGNNYKEILKHYYTGVEIKKN